MSFDGYPLCSWSLRLLRRVCQVCADVCARELQKAVGFATCRGAPRQRSAVRASNRDFMSVYRLGAPSSVGLRERSLRPGDRSCLYRYTRVTNRSASYRPCRTGNIAPALRFWKGHCSLPPQEPAPAAVVRSESKSGLVMVRTTLSFHSISYAVDLPGRKEHGKFGLQERRRAVACCMHARMHARTDTDAHSTQL